MSSPFPTKTDGSHIVRRSSRERHPNMANKEAVDAEQLRVLLHRRAGHASNVSRKCGEFVTAVDAGCSKADAKQILDSLSGAFGEFKEIHDKVVWLASRTQPERQNVDQRYFVDVECTVKRAWLLYDKMTEDRRESKYENTVTSDDSVSQLDSSVSKGSTSSARAKAAAKREALKAKVAYMRKQNELESLQLEREIIRKEKILQFEAAMDRQRFETDTSIKQIKLEAEIEAASVEESTLAKYVKTADESECDLSNNVKLQKMQLDGLESPNYVEQYLASGPGRYDESNHNGTNGNKTNDHNGINVNQANDHNGTNMKQPNDHNATVQVPPCEQSSPNENAMPVSTNRCDERIPGVQRHYAQVSTPAPVVQQTVGETGYNNLDVSPNVAENVPVMQSQHEATPAQGYHNAYDLYCGQDYHNATTSQRMPVSVSTEYVSHTPHVSGYSLNPHAHDWYIPTSNIDMNRLSLNPVVKDFPVHYDDRVPVPRMSLGLDPVMQESSNPPVASGSLGPEGLLQAPRSCPVSTRSLEPHQSMTQVQNKLPVAKGALGPDTMTQNRSMQSSQVNRSLGEDSLVRLFDMMNLPKTSLMKYDGNPLSYWVFMNGFDSCVGNLAVDPGAKLNRLFEYCTGDAAKVIKPCALMKPHEGYLRARELLRDRFGNEYKIAQAWIRKVTEGPEVKANNGTSIQEFADDLRSCVETLRAMGKLDEIDSRCRLVKIVERLPFYLQGRWRSVAVSCLDNTGCYPNIEAFVDFLDRISREWNDPVFGATCSPDKGKRTSRPQARSKGTSFNVQASTPSNETSAENSEERSERKPTKFKCPMCSEEHKLYRCPQFGAKSAADRLEYVRAHRLCLNCMNSNNHWAKWCKMSSCCGVNGCKAKHSRLLHDALSQSTKGRNQNGQMDHRSREKPSSNVLVCGSKVEGKTKIALPTVAVWVKGPNQDDFVQTHALLDTGSNRTFCSTKLLEELGVTGKETTLSLETMNAGKTTTVVELELEIMGTTGKRKHRPVIKLPCVYALDTFPNLNSSIVSPKDIGKWEHLRDVEVPQMTKSGVMLLIGQDIPKALCPLEVRHGCDNQPYATRTALGWVLNGPLSDVDYDGHNVSAFVQADDGDLQLQTQVERFWKVDDVVNTQELSINDKKVLHLWDEAAKLENNHYELPIPFKESPPSLPNNLVMAEKRLKSLGRRLQRDGELRQRYKTEIDSMIKDGYAEKVPKEESEGVPGKTWYLPHHNVRNPNKPQKFRIVFDCAATYDGTSLNQRVHQGPDMTNKLLGVLQRFRIYPFAMMGDIKAMYHQVRVTPADRDALRFLWWDEGDPEKDVVVYRMTAHLFGGIWSPSCATYALRRTASDNRAMFPDVVVEAVSRHFYVDDCLMSNSDEQLAVTIIPQLCDLLSRGGFKLTKWLANSRLVLGAVPENDRAEPVKSQNMDLAPLPVERALGVCWDSETDKLGIRIKKKEPLLTKRGLLSIMSSVYDPLGFVAPYILLAKKIFQDECRQSKEWDDQLSNENKRKWIQWIDDLAMLENFKVERCLLPFNPDQIAKLEMHHFCDASTEAYGAVSYLRIVDVEGKVSCSFLQAKARLAPLKTLTIPRLELLGAVTAVKLDGMLRTELELPGVKSVFWTDSTVVLHYIQNESRRFQTFVANRIAMIHEGSSPNQWRHVDTGSNPADDASRGMSASDMVACERWKSGPEFLWKDESYWPKLTIAPTSVLENDPELKKTSKTFAVVCDADLLEELINKYSCWKKLRKALAWLIRFHRWLSSHRKQTLGKFLTVAEIEEAETCLVKYLQTKSFESEIHQLQKGGDVSRKSPLYSLGVFLDGDNLLRVGGRLRQAPIALERRNPVVLPRDHHASELIVRHIHCQQSGHSGREHTLSLLREKYWVPRVRPLINRVLRHCVLCRRLKGKLGIQRMADLPKDRVTPNQPPFSHVGVDCFGPFLVKRGRSHEKRYGCLFTCLSIRAIHIEVLSSMECDSFINALVRFSARRGVPVLVRSDNGTNFTAAERELREALETWKTSKRIQSHCLWKGIEWVFNPPAASNMGGVWERQIRTTRKVLNSILRNQVLDDERLQTAFCEVESIVNGRPLTKVSDDPDDSPPLTPNHLLLLREGLPKLPGQFVKEDSFGRRWRHVQLLADQFWKRWLSEYLPLLQTRHKWLERSRNFEEGDIVLVLDEAVPRKNWPLARVVEVYPGNDGFVRSVKVKTKSSELVRPITKLCLLEGVSE